MPSLGTCLPPSYRGSRYSSRETPAYCVNGKITFADQAVGEGHSRLHKKGSDDMDCPCCPGLSVGSDLRSGMGQGGTRGVSPTSTSAESTVRHGRAAAFRSTVDRPGSWSTAVLGFLLGDLVYLYLLRTCLYRLTAQRNRGTVTVLFLARATARPTLGP